MRNKEKDLEISLLRGVYEAIRRVHRFAGVDSKEVEKSYEWLNDAIDQVKLFDGGYLEVVENLEHFWLIAPDWINYIAMNKNNKWFGFEKLPFFGNGHWWVYTRSDRCMMLEFYNSTDEPCHKSLHRRPDWPSE